MAELEKDLTQWNENSIENINGFTTHLDNGNAGLGSERIF